MPLPLRDLLGAATQGASWTSSWWLWCALGYIYIISWYICNFIFCNIFACFELGNLNNLSGAHPIATMKFVHQDLLWWRRTVFNWDSRHPSNRIKLGPRRDHGSVPGSWTHGFSRVFIVVQLKYTCTMNSCMTLVKQVVPRILEAAKTQE